MFNRLVAYVRGLTHREAAEGEAVDELHFHVDRETDANIARGLSPAEARRAALRDLGGLTPTLQAVRDVRAVALSGLWQDVRYAGRQLLRAPVFSLLVILCLGLGIGANTALFAVADGGPLQALPYRDPGSVVTLNETQPQLDTRGPVSAPNFVELQDAEPNDRAPCRLSTMGIRAGDPRRTGTCDWRASVREPVSPARRRPHRGTHLHSRRGPVRRSSRSPARGGLLAPAV